jgi:hypothetical protein
LGNILARGNLRQRLLQYADRSGLRYLPEQLEKKVPVELEVEAASADFW